MSWAWGGVRLEAQTIATDDGGGVWEANNPSDKCLHGGDTQRGGDGEEERKGRVPP